MHITLQNDLYLFQINRTEFQTRKNREEDTPVNKSGNKKNEQDFLHLLQNQLNQSTM